MKYRIVGTLIVLALVTVLFLFVKAARNSGDAPPDQTQEVQP